MERTIIAVDIAKKVFQLHWVEMDTGCIERLHLKRAKMPEWFANRTAALVVMEACRGAHDWGRALIGLGHEVRLISPWTVGRSYSAKKLTLRTPKRSGSHASSRACASFPSLPKPSRLCCHCTDCVRNS